MSKYKQLEDLAIKQSGDADVGLVLPKILSQTIEAAARPERVGRQGLRMNTQILNKPGRSVNYRKRGTIVAGDVAETATPTEQDADYSVVVSTPAKGGVTLKISQECIDDLEFDVIRDQLIEVGEAMAQWEDLKIWREILSGAAEQTFQGSGDGSTKVFSLGKTLVTSIRSITLDGSDATSSLKAIDYEDGQIEFTAAPGTGTNNIVATFWYYATAAGERTSDEVIPADTPTDWDLDDIRECRLEVKNNNYKPRLMFISPYIESKLLSLTAFIDASQYGEREPILNGEIGKIMGMKVIVTTNLDAYGNTSVYIDERRAGWFTNKRNMYIKRKELQENDAYAFYVYQRFDPKMTQWQALTVGIEGGQLAGNVT
jgi:N4-gp56 family major capsid protein